MLFYVKGEMKGVVPLPPEQILELAIQEAETSINYKKQGKVLAGGTLVGRKAGCGIFNVDSPEELHALVAQMPMFPFCEWEIIPLIPTEVALERNLQALTSMRASK